MCITFFPATNTKKYSNETDSEDLPGLTPVNVFGDVDDVIVWNVNEELILDTFDGLDAFDEFDSMNISSAYVLDDFTYFTSGIYYVKYHKEDYDTIVGSGLVSSLFTNMPGTWGGQIDGIVSAYDHNWANDIDDYRFAFRYGLGTGTAAEQEYYLINKDDSFVNSDSIHSGSVIGIWGKSAYDENVFENSTINAAYIHDDKLYLFTGDQFVVHAVTDEGASEKIIGPPETIGNGVSGVTAAFVLNDIPYLFVNSDYYRLDGIEPDAITASATGIKGSWGNIPSEMQSGMSAALTTADNLYFIKGSQYVEYSTDVSNPKVPYEIANSTYEIVRLTTSTADALNQALLASVDTPTGIGGLLNATVQQIDEVPSFVGSDSGVASGRLPL